MTYIDNIQTIATAGRYIVRAHIDHDAHIPEGDVYVPQYVLPWHMHHASDIAVNMKQDTQDWLYSLQAHFNNSLWDRDKVHETMERYARIFHGVNARVFESRGYTQGDIAYIITWPDKEWTQLVGVDTSYTPYDVDVADLESYLWGDVITLSLYERVVWVRDTGETLETIELVDSISGLYINRGQGDSHVVAYAGEMLEQHTDDKVELLLGTDES